MSARVSSMLVLAALVGACTGTVGSAEDAGGLDGSTVRDTGTDATDDGGGRGDAGERDDAGERSDGGVRGVTHAEVLFEGTELDLKTQYGLYVQSDDSSIDLAPDPAGTHGDVIRFRHDKSSVWAHTMVRPEDARTDYTEPAQVRAYESVYHYQQQMYVRSDVQWGDTSFNLLEDFHCEPCEANSLQLFLNYDGEDSLCVWVAYSTDPDFDPRGLARGSSFDPWEELSRSRFYPDVAADGTPTLPTLPETASLLFCRDDLHTSDLFDRWVDVEMIVRPSSYDTGTVRVWIDGYAYRYDGPNNYRWNQLDADDPLPVNTFQIGLYGAPVEPRDGAPDYFELFTTPPRIELGDGILGE